MDEKLLELLVAIISLLSIVITRYVIPFIKANTDSEKLSEYQDWAILAVNAAEMIFVGQGLGEQKKTYVVEFLTKQFNDKKIVISSQQMEILIEAAVKQLKLEEN